MGVNLSIDAPGWDEFANGGMKEILHDPDRFPRVWRDPVDGELLDFRPADFPTWRAAIIELDCSVAMWLRGLDVLEADADKWIAASY